MATMLDGRETAEIYARRIARETKGLPRAPFLAVILAGDNPAGLVYDRMKMRKAKELGIESSLDRLAQETSEEELLALIRRLNGDRSVDAILVQLPLPPHMDTLKILSAIAPAKDADGFNPVNKGLLSMGDESGMVACTPLGIIRLLERYNVPIEGRRAAVIGRSNIVGRPMAMLLSNRSATVTLCHSKTKDLGAITREADIIVSAAGKTGLLSADMVKKGATVVDVAMNHDADGRLAGDTDIAGISEKAAFVTPIPGGVGPMTIITLMDNVVKAFKSQCGSGTR
ncbi:MAG: bifunctional 5,10-methylenetetrahydrofolate dehydrogenase/5,10-methenyltetrahydrofolate cyclohydrolase [Rickettsiales bacterium]|nr:bifunctional 5,10-methylenetetrahydrofolate dehydrogenase/5,10-methenyltetrahydrofolate cyclohydrolase [Rickettsiales bacterium]